jgi:hypothetical protein
VSASEGGADEKPKAKKATKATAAAPAAGAKAE